jgi:phosphoserine phosphatase
MSLKKPRRRFVKLLVLDVEGTIFDIPVRLPGTTIASTIWQGIAHALGPSAIEREIETHRLWEEGKYRSYLDWMQDTIRIHQEFGLTRSQFFGLINAAQYSDGARETLPHLNRDSYTPVLISGGFRELTRRAQVDLNIWHAFAACEYLFGSDGRVSGFNLLPCDFEGKIDFIRLMLREYGLTNDDWVFVGDGTNDIPIAREAPISIGFRPHPHLGSKVTHTIQTFTDLPSLLPNFSTEYAI